MFLGYKVVNYFVIFSWVVIIITNSVNKFRDHNFEIIVNHKQTLKLLSGFYKREFWIIVENENEIILLYVITCVVIISYQILLSRAAAYYFVFKILKNDYEHI